MNYALGEIGKRWRSRVTNRDIAKFVAEETRQPVLGDGAWSGKLRGLSRMSIDEVSAIAKEAGVDIDWLYSGEGIAPADYVPPTASELDDVHEMPPTDVQSASQPPRQQAIAGAKDRDAAPPPPSRGAVQRKRRRRPGQ